MGTIRFALEWPRQDLEHVWRALLATEELQDILGDDSLEICYTVNHEMLLEAVARGEPYVGVGDANTDCLMAAGVLQPIDDWVAQSRVIRPDNYLPAVWQRQFHQGRQCGVPAYLDGLQQATEVHVTRPCPVTRVLLVEWRRLRDLHHRGQLSAAAVARELQAIGDAALAREAQR